MPFSKSKSSFVWTVTCVVAISLLSDPTYLKATEATDLVKQIEKAFSSVERRIVTEPSRAETEFVAVGRLLVQLKTSSPNHVKLPTLEKRSTNLKTKLEKRLGRPIGGTAEKQPAASSAIPPKAAPSSLPSSVVSRLTSMETAMNAALAAIEKNRLQTATTKLKQAQKVMDEIHTRYEKMIPAGNVSMKEATDRLTLVTTKVSEANAAAAASAAAQAAIKSQMESQSKEWLDKFSLLFDRKNNEEYLRMGSDFYSASEADRNKSRQGYAKANDLMAIYSKTEFPHGKTTELKYLEQSLVGYLTLYNEEAARAQQEGSCRPWVEKLRAYVEVGAGSPKYLIVSTTLNEAEIQERAALLKEAQDLWPEYQKVEFPHGKSKELMGLEEEMQKRLTEMPETLRQSRALISGDLEKEFDRVLNYLNADTGWQNDQTKKPNLIMDRDVKSLRDALERYASTVQSSDAKLGILRQKTAQIQLQDQKNRMIRADRTYMEPDRYNGDDAGDLRQKVEAILKEKIAQAKPLRVTLPAENWKEEQLVEWTDTTHTTLKYRNTRFMTAQIAAHGPDGKVYLHAVHLAADRLAEGSWGPLYGHIMWSDWMAEKNAHQGAPIPQNENIHP